MDTVDTRTGPVAADSRNLGSERHGPFVIAPTTGLSQAARKTDAVLKDDMMQKADAMQESLLSVAGPAPELDGLEELGPQLAWVSLDAPRGLLVCKSLALEATEFVGTITESRVVRVMQDKDGGALCASSNRQLADVGRSGRECASCEDRAGGCFPRWWIAWQDEASGQMFAHTLSQIGTMNFSRYAAKLKRNGLTPSQTMTRLFVEETRRQQAGAVYRRIQFEQDSPFKND